MDLSMEFHGLFVEFPYVFESKRVGKHQVMALEWAKGPAGKASKRVAVADGEQPLPVGPVNMLRTEIVCRGPNFYLSRAKHSLELADLKIYRNNM